MTPSDPLTFRSDIALGPARNRDRQRFELDEVVQGVGFRPFVYRLAEAHALTGYVRNLGASVELEVQGASESIERFANELATTAPRAARIDAVRRSRRPIGIERDFRVIESGRGRDASVVPPDLPVCIDCVRDMLDPDDRRHRYPFTHCAGCGPRASILRDLPWDRERTTMARFAPCATCLAEYRDPLDRRFHAETIACPECGPKLRLRFSAHGRRDHGRVRRADDPLTAAAGLLRRGAILAVKGYGGFHLMADATNAATVARLRERKARPGKPFAVLVADVARARAIAEVGGHAALLESLARPIVLLPARASSALAEGVAPGLGEVGVMLPATPLQVLLLADSKLPVLIATSANTSGEPVIADDEQALASLAEVADAFLLHDRPIARRNDDSVVRPIGAVACPVRISRGIAPRTLRRAHGPTILALGGDLANAPVLAGRGEIHLLGHVGDLRSADAEDELVSSLTQHARLLGFSPDAVSHDLHPDYVTTRVARELGLPAIGVQHHHAHLAACLAEHGTDGPVLGVILDGAGWGTDGTQWGGEILLGGSADFRRLARLGTLALPGGDAAAREPWRMAVSAWHAVHGDVPMPAELGLAKRVPAVKLDAVRELVRRGGAVAPRTSSCGRLFDAAAGLLGVATVSSYEGEAAMRLEALADPCFRAVGDWGARVDGALDMPSPESDTSGSRTIPVAVVDPRPMLADVIQAQLACRDPAVTAFRFHVALASELARVTLGLARFTGTSRVVLSGGCLLNRILSELLARSLRAGGLEVLVHERVPPSDAGLAVGQAMVASARLGHRLGLEPVRSGT